jgi:hypothetical protein
MWDPHVRSTSVAGGGIYETEFSLSPSLLRLLDPAAVAVVVLVAAAASRRSPRCDRFLFVLENWLC